MDAFESRWRHDALVMDKWFAIQAATPGAGTVDRVEALQTALSRADEPDADLNQRLYDTRMERLELRERMVGIEAPGLTGTWGSKRQAS